MRKVFYILLLFALLVGCESSKKGFLPFSFSVDYDVPQQTLPGDPLLSTLPPQTLPDIPVNLNADSEFNTQIFHYLTGVELERLTFTITADSTDPAIDDLEPAAPASPTPDDWSFFESAEIWFKHPVTSEEAMVACVASGDPQLSSGSITLSFTCTGVNMLDYFNKSYQTILIIRAVGTCPPDDVIFVAGAKFKVDAVLLKS